jgi:hypothetical protein
MIHTFEEHSGNRLLTRLNYQLAYLPREDLSVATSSEVQLHNVIGYTPSFEFSQDISKFWHTKTRWNLLVRQYLNQTSLNTWLDAIESKLQRGGRGVAVMRTNLIGPRSNANGQQKWRTWGACILSLSYRSTPRPQITMHSRTSYMGFLSVLDMAVAHVCARMIADRLGIPVYSIAFLWHIESAQFHSFKSLPYFLMSEKRRHHVIADDNVMTTPLSPAVYNAQKMIAAFDRMDDKLIAYGDMTFGQSRRARKRYHTEVFGYEFGAKFEHGKHSSPSQNKRMKKLPSLRTDELDFSSLRVPANVDNAMQLVELVEGD